MIFKVIVTRFHHLGFVPIVPRTDDFDLFPLDRGLDRNAWLASLILPSLLVGIHWLDLSDIVQTPKVIWHCWFGLVMNPVFVYNELVPVDSSHQILGDLELLSINFFEGFVVLPLAPFPYQVDLLAISSPGIKDILPLEDTRSSRTYLADMSVPTFLAEMRLLPLFFQRQFKGRKCFKQKIHDSIK